MRKSFAASLIVWAMAGSALAYQQAQPSLGDQAYRQAHWAFEHASKVHYKHNHGSPADQVAESMRDGSVTAENDCTGFVSWVLHEVAPERLYAIEAFKPGQECPQAETFARFFASLSAEQATKGWVAVPSVYNLRRGDFIAWNEANAGKHGNTGHVMIVAAPPSPVQQTAVDGRTVNFVSVRVIDSSSVVHFPPEKLPPLAEQSQRDGIGEGDVRLVINDYGKPLEHWEGTYWGEGKKSISQPAASPIIACARMVGTNNYKNKVRSIDLEYDMRTRNRGF